MHSVAFLKKYWLVILTTIAVSAFTALPSFFFFQNVGDDFRGIYPVFNSDALYYQTRIQEISDGHGELNHPYFFEHKDAVYPQAIGAEYFLYGITKLFGIAAPALQIILDIIAPALIFLLTYLLLKRFSPNEYTAVLLPSFLYTVVMGGLFKPVNPQITLPILLLFLIFWVKLILDDKKKLRNSMIAGVLWGLLFLTYFYHWSFVVVIVGLYGLILLAKKSYAELKYHSIMVGIAALIGIPYFVRVCQGVDAPFHAETAVRVGLYFSHLPESYPRLMVAIVWFLFFLWFRHYYRLQHDTRATIVGVLLAGNIIYPNHQIITGMIIENAVHWSWMPILIFAVSGHYLFSVVRKHQPTVKNISVFFVIAVLLILPAWRLYTFTWKPYLGHYADGATEQRQYYADVFNWVNAHTQKDDTILSDPRLMRFIPAYTHANVYNTEYAFNLPASDDEVVERYLLARFFDSDSGASGVNGQARILWSFAYESEKNTHTIAGTLAIPYEPKYSLAQEREKIEGVRAGLVKQGWGIALLNKYRIDYIVWDRNEKPEWSLGRYAELEEVARIGDVSVYQFKS
ncbi:hypothetical protein BK004_01235 [bacterium CG10_46_32]|nr:MAG: hypothetical protein BK004_01235 [bacterium CG10_46_32]PIR56322.1 MAG: hypothetical protein COU73_01250 [Parcubacteria group bacterium CG10_big_fil_rev_8_21_14_0_10_46_32]